MNALEKHLHGLKVHAKLVNGGMDSAEASKLLNNKINTVDLFRSQFKVIESSLDTSITVMLNMLSLDKINSVIDNRHGVRFNDQDQLYRITLEKHGWTFHFESPVLTHCMILQQMSIDDKLGLLEAIEEVL